MLVALAVFATMAALAYGGLDSVVRARAELGREQAGFSAMMRSVDRLARDLRQAANRPVRDNRGGSVPALAGGADRIEMTRIGFANPQAEQRSNLERVFYVLDGKSLQRGAYPVLDRAPTTQANVTTLRGDVDAFHLRYLDAANRWSDSWPPLEAHAGTATVVSALPRAIEFRIQTNDCGDISRIIELPAEK